MPSNRPDKTEKEVERNLVKKVEVKVWKLQTWSRWKLVESHLLSPRKVNTWVKDFWANLKKAGLRTDPYCIHVFWGED